MIAKRLGRSFLQLFIYILARSYEIRKRRAAKSHANQFRLTFKQSTYAVEEIQPLPTGEYRLRVKGGQQYLVTRTYKHSLRDLAQLWVGAERLCG